MQLQCRQKTTLRAYLQWIPYQSVSVWHSNEPRTLNELSGLNAHEWKSAWRYLSKILHLPCDRVCAEATLFASGSYPSPSPSHLHFLYYSFWSHNGEVMGVHMHSLSLDVSLSLCSSYSVCPLPIITCRYRCNAGKNRIYLRHCVHVKRPPCNLSLKLVLKRMQKP
jgi:hypothetical protein